MNAAVSRRVGLWLAVWSVMVALTVVIGGVTRLTESGLSITEWRPVSGVLPPLTAAAWEAEFARYRAIPEFQVEAPDMTIDGFKQIYFWEYLHRLWARLVGLAIAAPLLVGLARKWFPGPLAKRLVAMTLLTGAQGALGWYMVKSGLTELTDVSQYRLAAHLGLALVIFVLAVWTAADLLQRDGVARDRAPYRGYAVFTTGFVFLVCMAGAFVAGTNAGKVYNEFPLMAGRFVPEGYLSLDPWYRNFFDNVAAVQFNHRWLAAVLTLVVGWLAVRMWQAGESSRRLAMGFGFVVAVQFALGLWTLLGSVPIPVAALHQLGAVALLGLAVLAVHRASPAPGLSRADPGSPPR